VGAGLPAMSPLRNMDKTGDKIIKIEGVFSGTLSYLINLELEQKNFQKSCTKPFNMVDPRDDLSAMDFARKLVILSRECGLVLSLEGISIHSLVEKELENLYVKDFLAKLPDYDSKMDNLYLDAKKDGIVLCFMMK